jgi:hypothetical protein
MNPKNKNGQFKALSLNEKIRRAFKKNPNRAAVAKALGIRYQRVNNVVQKMFAAEAAVAIEALETAELESIEALEVVEQVAEAELVEA